MHRQHYAAVQYDPSLAGEAHCDTEAIPSMPMSIRKVIARRGALELKPHCVINLGIGIPSGVGAVANEEGIAAQTTLSPESGPIGGVPVEGTGFGGSMNAEVINTLCDPYVHGFGHCGNGCHHPRCHGSGSE